VLFLKRALAIIAIPHSRFRSSTFPKKYGKRPSSNRAFLKRDIAIRVLLLKKALAIITITHSRFRSSTFPKKQKKEA